MCLCAFANLGETFKNTLYGNGVWVQVTLLGLFVLAQDTAITQLGSHTYCDVIAQCMSAL